jgi:arsenate reductase-like glutaredoxin family protein
LNIQIFGKSKCFDTKKAERYFKERGIKYQSIDLIKYGISKGELKSVMAALGGLEKLLDEKNRDIASVKYLAYDEDKLEKVLDNPGLLKTPIVRNGNKSTLGCCPDIWSGWA